MSRGRVVIRRCALAVGVVLVLVLAACGDSGEPAADGPIEIVSEGGEAVLTVAAGSLPEGISLEDIAIDWALGTSAEPGAPAVGVALVPSGLVLSEPATLRMELPDTLGSEFLAIHSDSGGFEFISVEIEFEDDKRYAVASIGHFSTLELDGNTGLFKVSSATAPVQVVVKKPQQLRGVVSPTGTTSLGVWIHTENDQYRFHTFEDVEYAGGAKGFVAWSGSRSSGGRIDPYWIPRGPETEVAGDRNNVEFLAESQCQIPNSVDPTLFASLPVTMKLKAKGEFETRQLLRFGGKFVGEQPVMAILYSYDDVEVETTVTAKVMSSDIAESECVGSLEEPPVTAPGRTETPPVTASGRTETPPVDDFDHRGHHCTGGYQVDTAWNQETDGKGNVTEPESESARDAAGDIDRTCVFAGSYGFIMTVKGDGESLSKQDYTSYQVSFIVNNAWPDNVYYDDTGFMVLVQWNHLAEQYTGQTFGNDFSPTKGADVHIEWLDGSTLQVIVDLPGDQIEVTEMRTEVYVYISDADDNYVYDHRDVAIWTAQP